MPRFPVRPLDFVVFLIAAAVLVAFSRQAIVGASGPAVVEIQAAEATYVYPLDEDRHVHVPGPLGESIVLIENGTVRFIESPCREKICVATGELVHTGEWAACLPNHVFVTVRGTDASAGAADAVSY